MASPQQVHRPRAFRNCWVWHIGAPVPSPQLTSFHFRKIKSNAPLKTTSLADSPPTPGETEQNSRDVWKEMYWEGPGPSLDAEKPPCCLEAGSPGKPVVCSRTNPWPEDQAAAGSEAQEPEAPMSEGRRRGTPSSSPQTHPSPPFWPSPDVQSRYLVPISSPNIQSR